MTSPKTLTLWGKWTTVAHKQLSTTLRPWLQIHFATIGAPTARTTDAVHQGLGADNYARPFFKIDIPLLFALMIPIDDSTYQRRSQLIGVYLHFLSSLLVARKNQLLAVKECSGTNR